MKTRKKSQFKMRFAFWSTLKMKSGPVSIFYLASQTACRKFSPGFYAVLGAYLVCIYVWKMYRIDFIRETKNQLFLNLFFVFFIFVILYNLFLISSKCIQITKHDKIRFVYGFNFCFNFDNNLSCFTMSKSFEQISKIFCHIRHRKAYS